jgi:hypothetical protein
MNRLLGVLALVLTLVPAGVLLAPVMTAQAPAKPEAAEARTYKPADKDVRFPDLVPSVPTPPRPPPSSIAKLSAEVFYVIQADVPATVTSSPEGLVTVVGEPGPLRVRGRFIEEPERVQTKTFTAKHLFIVEAAASGRCEVLVVVCKADGPADVLRRTIDVSIEPRPPPVPPVPPVPPPPPIPGQGNMVLMVYETADLSKMPEKQLQVMYSKQVRDYLTAKTGNDADGKTKAWRVWDQNVDTSAEAKTWKDLMARPRASVPWMVVRTDAKGAHEGPLPSSVDEAMTLLKKYLE